MFVESYPDAANIINDYLEQGYEVKQIIPEFCPAIQEEGVFTFYKDGFTVYFEKEFVDE
jgi:hypothetical protein